MSVTKSINKFFKKALKVVPTVVTAASIVAAVTPTPVDDGIIAAADQLVDLLALNVGHASNGSILKENVPGNCMLPY